MRVRPTSGSVPLARCAWLRDRAVDVANDRRRRGGGGRLLGVGLLAGIVALLIAYFGNCVPGFGPGGSLVPGTPEPAPSRTDAPAKAPVGSGAVQVKIDGEQCRRGGDPAVPCPELCKTLAAGKTDGKVEVDGTLGTHATVDAFRRCLTDAGFRDVVVRAE